MKLKVHKREADKKSAPKNNRREGKIPSILYGGGGVARPIAVQREELEAHLRALTPGLLATTRFTLEEEGKTFEVLIKDIQYHPVTYSVLHLDFFLLQEGKPITVNIPIQVTGQMDCVGIKLGGTLRQVIRSLKARCLPKDIPQKIEIDIKDLNVGESRRLSDLPLPSSIRPLAKMGEIAVMVAKKG